MIVLDLPLVLFKSILVYLCVLFLARLLVTFCSVFMGLSEPLDCVCACLPSANNVSLLHFKGRKPSCLNSSSACFLN